MKIKNLILGIVIAILLVLTVGYGINTFYERPDYEDFCPRVYDIYNQSSCEVAGGTWIDEVDNVKAPVEERMLINRCQEPTGCYDEYDVASEKYSRNLFLIALPLGIIIVVVGAAVFGLEFIGAGLMGGGVLTILYGVINYWQYSDDLLKFILSLVGLVIVIWFGYWLNKRAKK